MLYMARAYKKLNCWWTVQIDLVSIKNISDNFKYFFWGKKYSSAIKQAGVKIKALTMSALIFAPSCLQFYKSTDKSVSLIEKGII